MDVYRDYFTREELVLAIDKAPFIPGMLAAEFETIPDVTGTTVGIEELGLDSVTESAAIPRGSPAGTLNLAKAKVHTFTTQTYAEEIPILADSVLGMRAPGTPNPDVIIRRRDRAVTKLRNWADTQHEFMRVASVNAPSNAFGNAPDAAIVAFGTNDSAVRTAIHTHIVKPIEAALGGIAYGALNAYCSDAYWVALIESKTVRETYLNWTAAAELRNAPSDSFRFGGIMWHRYRESGNLAISAGTAKIIPRVPGLFAQAFAPDDTLSSVGVGESGQPYYLRSFDLDDDKGFRLKMQTHPVMVCTRPAAVITVDLS